MADQVRVFVSHHHSPEEEVFTARLVDDLKAGGADVWVDDEGINSEDFVRKISEGLAGRQWLVLVLTPASANSPWVQREVNAALNEVTARRMLGVVPLVMTPTPEQDLLALWRPLHRYDASRLGYEAARDGLLGAFGLRPPTPAAPTPPSPPPQPTPAPTSAVPNPVPRATNFPAPVVPEKLARLGYTGVNVTGTPAYIPPLVTIPAGAFLMGSDQTRDPQAAPSEFPLHWVEVGEFRIAKFPVTVAEYHLAVRAGSVYVWSYNTPKSLSDYWFQNFPFHPVGGVTWDDAMRYIEWLRRVTGQPGWRLPTEAEWEKAARWDPVGRTSRIYPWGDHFESRRCNSKEQGNNTTTQVDTFRQRLFFPGGVSAFGVEDMAGNVWEWTSSWYKPYPYDHDDGRETSPLPASGHPDTKETKVLRGGSYQTQARSVRAAGRNAYQRNSMGEDFGFRLAY